MSKNTNQSESQLLLPIVNENEAPLCACGCGIPTKWDTKHKKFNIYIHGHHVKSMWQDTEYRESKSKQVKGQMFEQWQDPVFRDKMSKQTKEQMIKQWQDPERREKHFRRMKERFLEQWQNLVFRDKMSKQSQAIWQDSELRESASKQSKERWQNPEYRENISKRMKELWQNPIYVKKCLSALGRSPNIPEALLIALTPENVEYVGNGKWWRTLKVMTVDGLMTKHKNPDFLVKGQKKVIEFNGKYWHKDDYPDEAWQEAWRNIGFECLIIWEEELKDIDSVLTRIGKFIGQEQWQLEFSLVGG